MNLETFVKLVEILSVPLFGRRHMVLVLVLTLGGHHFVHNGHIFRSIKLLLQNDQ